MGKVTWQEELALAMFKEVSDRMHELYVPIARDRLGGGFPSELIHSIPSLYNNLQNLYAMLSKKDADKVIDFFTMQVENLMDEIEASVAKA